MPADYIRTVPTIDLTDDELAAAAAAIRRAIFHHSGTKLGAILLLEVRPVSAWVPQCCALA
jgi:hypothetical protein